MVTNLPPEAKAKWAEASACRSLPEKIRLTILQDGIASVRSRLAVATNATFVPHAQQYGDKP